MGVFTVGDYTLRLYSLLIMLGLAAGAWLATREAKRRGVNPGWVLDSLIFCVPLALVGARLYHVVSSWSYYQHNLGDIPAIWRGGIGIYGAVAGAILGIYIFTLWRKQPLSRWLDIGAPGLLLGQAVGRWGNYFNQELYGPPTDAPWGIRIDPQNRLAEYPNAERFHPLFFYEFLWNILGVVTLLYLGRRFRAKLKEGDIALAYCIVYPLGRFMLETYRFDAWKVSGFPAAAWVSLAAMLICGGALVYRHRPRLDIHGAAWGVLVAGVSGLAIGAYLASENARPFLVELTAVWTLVALEAIARLSARSGGEVSPARARRSARARR